MADLVPARPSIGYVKGLPPSSPASQPGYLQSELGKIERASRDIITDLTSRVTAAEDKLKALIAAEAKAREEGDEGSAKRATELTRSLKTELGEVKASITREETVRVTNTEAVARIIESLNAAIIDGRNQARAQITDERLVRANALEALARRVDSMSASFASAQGQTNARIETEEEVRASAVEAVATRTTTLETEVITGPNALKSRVQTVESSVSTLASSTASRLSTLESEVITGGPGTIKARIGAQETAFTDFTGAQASINSTLSAQATGVIGPLATTRTLAAAIDTELKAWVNLETGTSTASFQQTLSSAINGVRGDITTFAETASTVDSIQQKYGVTLNANGQITGFQILNSSVPGSSSFTIQADKFGIAFPGSTKTPFNFENVLVNGAYVPTLTIDGIIKAGQFQDGSVGTTQIASGAVTNAVGSDTATAPAITTVGGKLLINAVCKAPIVIVGDTPVETTVELKRNGLTIQSRSGIGQIAFLAVDSQAAGTYTYSLFTSAVSGISETAIAVVELRR